MTAFAFALLLAACPGTARVLTSNPPIYVCEWKECDADGKCRLVTEKEQTTCEHRRTRTECDEDGKNCRTWTVPTKESSR